MKLLEIFSSLLFLYKKGGFCVCTFDKILLEMKNKRISQKSITDLLGLNQSIFTQWKKGENTSYLKHISKIAEYLEVSTDYLLGNEQKEKSSPQLSDKDLKGLELFKQLKDEDKEFFIKLLQDRIKQ